MSQSESSSSNKKSKKLIASIMSDIETEASLFLNEEPTSETFIPEVTEEELIAAQLNSEELNSEEINSETENATEFLLAESQNSEEISNIPNEDSEILESEDEFSDESVSSKDESALLEAALEGTELEGFESAQIEDIQFIEDERAESIIESILFASDRPVSLASIQMVFKGTNVKREKIKKALENIAVEYAGGRRGVVLEEITSGYQIRTKIDNMNFLKQTVKAKAFKLSGPALETMAIVAYKQPVVKVEIDQIRGVESGHLLRALMEKGLVAFNGKAEHLPGKPMQYGSTRRFLEIFGLRNLKELPTLSQIDELLPEGIGDDLEEKQTLSMVTDAMSEQVKSVSYSEGEEELGLIENQLTSISTSSEFFEQEKQRQKMKRDEEKAQNIREAISVNEEVSKRDLNWLKKYEEALLFASQAGDQAQPKSDKTDSVNDSAIVGATTDNLTNTDNTDIELSPTEEFALHDLDMEEEDEEAAHIEDEIPFLAEADDDEPSHDKIPLDEEELS